MKVTKGGSNNGLFVEKVDQIIKLYNTNEHIAIS